MSNSKVDDPRDASLEVPFSLPNTWPVETGDGLAASGLFLSGLIMVTRNRLLAWPSLFFGINSLINQHPLRTKESAGGLTNIGLAVAALVASYIPVLIVQSPTPAA